jgi:hypothetical protein
LVGLFFRALPQNPTLAKLKRACGPFDAEQGYNARGLSPQNHPKDKWERYDTYSQGHDQKNACYRIDHFGLSRILGGHQVLVSSKADVFD